MFLLKRCEWSRVPLNFYVEYEDYAGSVTSHRSPVATLYMDKDKNKNKSIGGRQGNNGSKLRVSKKPAARFRPGPARRPAPLKKNYKNKKY